MKVFVTGATGFQGGNIAGALLNDGHRVTTLKRDLNTGQPAMEGIAVIQGGLDSQDALSKAMSGAQAAVHSFPLIFDIEIAKAYTKKFIAAAKQENVDLIIFNTTFHLAKEKTGFLAIDLKVAMKELFDASGLNVITLAPDTYLDNISAPWSIPVILENKIVPYPISADTKLPWISHFDLGRYVAKAFTKPELAGKTLPIGGNMISGNEIAMAISSEIGENLNFVPLAVNDFEQQLTSGFGAIAAKEISNLYRFIEENHNEFVDKDYAQTDKILDITPQPLNEWVSSVNWTLQTY